ncbi:hypothetical protein KFE25_009104 [Diacronema lutheri]|uniref:START domain-containing protein n=1 Tax=Diacronema lutheri TaxID=2081491 RepID=A0A8J5XS23_DIALT|nr:hypothetical protein KFE25_009104 [Diacronema lutheri]
MAEAALGLLETSESAELTDALRISACGAGHFSAVLLKRSTYLHQWKRRPVVLKGHGDGLCLTFNKQNAETTLKLGGRSLSVAMHETVRDRKSERELGHSEIYPFTTDASRSEWLRVLGALLGGRATWSELATLQEQRGALVAAACATPELPAAAAGEGEQAGAVPGVRAAAPSSAPIAGLATTERPATAASEDARRAPSVLREERAPRARGDPALRIFDAPGERWRLHEVRDGVRLFVEEQVNALTQQSSGWAWPPLGADAVVSLLVLVMALGAAAAGKAWAASAMCCVLALPLALALAGSAHAPVRPRLSAQLTGRVRATTSVRCSPELAFAVVMGTGPARFEWDGAFDGARVIDSLDRHSDVLHVRLPALSVAPFCVAAPRDACVLRYWRRESSSSLTVVYLPFEHVSCPPPASGSVRAVVIGSAITIRAAKPRPADDDATVGATPGLRDGGTSDAGVSIISHVLHFAPRGWLGHPWCTAMCARYQLWVVGQLLPLRLYAEQQEADSLDAQLIEDYIAPSGKATAVASTRSAHTLSAREPTVAAGLQQLPPALNEASLLLRAAAPAPAGRAPRRAAAAPSAAELEVLCSLRRAAHGEDTHCWDEPEPQTFKLRGASYLTDRLKVPAPEGSTLMQLIAIDLICAAQPIEHAAARPGSPALRESADNFVLVVNLQLPGSPAVSLVLFWAVKRQDMADGALMARLEWFADAATDEERNSVLKLVPSVQEGNWIVRRAVGQKPVILGRALHTSYHGLAGRYIEVDVDISSSSVAAGVLRIVRGASRTLVVDLAFVLEGQSDEELPERPLACARLMCVDLDLATPIDAPNDSGAAMASGPAPEPFDASSTGTSPLRADGDTPHGVRVLASAESTLNGQ